MSCLTGRYLSSAAAAARQRLTERIFSAADQPCLGIPDSKSPPEKSMYLSVLRPAMCTASRRRSRPCRASRES